MNAGCIFLLLGFGVFGLIKNSAPCRNRFRMVVNEMSYFGTDNFDCYYKTILEPVRTECSSGVLFICKRYCVRG